MTGKWSVENWYSDRRRECGPAESPCVTRVDIDERLKDFFASGAQLAWAINPETESVEVCHSPTPRKLIGSGGFLEKEHLLPGFRYAIANLFNEWDWE